MVEAVIQSAGYLEIVLLHESLASIIGPDLYTVFGEAPNQEIRFSNEHYFDLLLVRLVEVFPEGSDVVTIEGRNKNLVCSAVWAA